MKWRKLFIFSLSAAMMVFLILNPAAFAKAEKPNILVIWGDDIGWNNPSCYNRGMMGYKTPNIDRIADEGALFTDWYGQLQFRTKLHANSFYGIK